jgi:hypothetical protein
LLLFLLAIVSADVICNGNSTTDLASTLTTDTNITVDAELTVDTTVVFQYQSSDEYRMALEQRFDSHADLTVDEQAQINATVKSRLDNIQTQFEASIQKTADVICLSVKKGVIVSLLSSINATFNADLDVQFGVFQAYEIALNATFNAWISVVSGNDAVAIASAQISIDEQRATKERGDVKFYVEIENQKVYESYTDVANTVYAWLNDIAIGASSSTIAADRAAAELAIAASLRAQIDYRRALELQTKMEDYLTSLQANLTQAKTELENAASRAWADVRADIIAHFQATSAKVEMIRMRLADYLAGIHCDTTSMNFTADYDSNDSSGSVTVHVRGIVCYDNRTADQIHAIACACLKAYFLTDTAAASANAYTCAIVNQKRSYLGAVMASSPQGTEVNADVVAANPNNPPSPVAPSAPIPAPSSSSFVVASFVLLLLALLSHF